MVSLQSIAASSRIRAMHVTAQLKSLIPPDALRVGVLCLVQHLDDLLLRRSDVTTFSRGWTWSACWDRGPCLSFHPKGSVIYFRRGFASLAVGGVGPEDPFPPFGFALGLALGLGLGWGWMLVEDDEFGC